MILTETTLTGAVLVDIEMMSDDRGGFARTWCAREFAAAGLADVTVQSSIATNHVAGTLRGMHFQAAPHAEAKLVRCTRGAIYDVLVDLRPESATYLQWIGIELSAASVLADIEEAGFARVILVGNSIASATMPGVAAQLAGRVERLVFFGTPGSRPGSQQVSISNLGANALDFTSARNLKAGD